MAVGDLICNFRPFVSSIVPSEETTARDLEILKGEVENYLAELLTALCTELEEIRDNCCGGA